MQQTDKYKLNLIETSDTFSPAPLNENAQKLEAALETARAEAAAGDAAEAAARAALDQRVTALEVHKCVVGYHGGTGFVDLGFTPSAVFAVGGNGNSFVTQGHGIAGYLNIVEGGFEHFSNFTSCRYVALV